MCNRQFVLWYASLQRLCFSERINYPDSRLISIWIYLLPSDRAPMITRLLLWIARCTIFLPLISSLLTSGPLISVSRSVLFPHAIARQGSVRGVWKLREIITSLKWNEAPIFLFRNRVGWKKSPGNTRHILILLINLSR